jgi:hypothetical protein
LEISLNYLPRKEKINLILWCATLFLFCSCMQVQEGKKFLCV